LKIQVTAHAPLASVYTKKSTFKHKNVGIFEIGVIEEINSLKQEAPQCDENQVFNDLVLM
jgi:hypothetical protein